MNPLSKRQLFRAILPEKRIIDHLDALHLGYLAKRKARVNLAKKFEASDTYDNIENHRSRNRIRGKLRPDVLDKRREASPYPFNKEGKFLYKASDWKAVPRGFPGDPPEIALIGRSNVGKSTLLNALLSLEETPLVKAIVSEKPGETRHLQFYSVGRSEDVKSATADGSNAAPVGPALVVTDMPGFGFAYMNTEDVVRCQEISKMYLTRRGSSLKRVLLLLDARHGLKSGDEKFFRELFATTASSLSGDKKEAREQYIYPGDKNSMVKWKLQVVLTKCDLVERFELARRIQVIKQKMKEILPNIGYTSLPVLAISSLEDRGMQELKRELSSLCMRTPVEEPVAVDHVQKALTAQFNFENDQALSKLRRTWQPMEKFQLSSELDRSFKVRGGSIDTALALKDATRHKQPTGSGAWLSSRTKDDLEASMSLKKRGIFTAHTDRSTIVTDLGGLPEQDIPAVVVPVEKVAKVTSSALIQTPTQAYLAKPVQPVKDSWELKTQRAEEQRRKNRLLNTSLGSLKDVGGGAQSSMTRLNQINSGMPESFTNNHQTFLAKQFPAPAKRRGQSLSSIKAPRSGRDIPASPATSKISAEPAPPVKVIVKPANKSGDLITQFMERKELLPLDNMTREQRRKYREHSIAVRKKYRKISPQRLERRERRDIQFGRKVAVKPTDVDVDEGAVEDDFSHDDDVEVEAPVATPRRAGRVRPARVTRERPSKTETETEEEADVEASAEKPTEKPREKPATPRTQVREKVRMTVRAAPSDAQGDKPMKKKSFSKVDKGVVKLKKSEIRYANSFREKKPFTNEYSKTSTFSFDLKGARKIREDKPVNFKNDFSYNDNNAPKPFTGRPKTKFGKVVGSKATAKSAIRKDFSFDKEGDKEKPPTVRRKKSEFLRRSSK